MENTKEKKYKTEQTSCLYLSPGGENLVDYQVDHLPSVKPGYTRVVCISDTHNEHNTLNLPWGHILVHSGDVMTESGLRWTSKQQNSVFVTVKQPGYLLLESFGSWLGKLPHPHKLIIGGNHDWVLQALGSNEVQKAFEKHCEPGSVIYLEHEEASVGHVNVFGSPYAHWGSHNDAFKSDHIEYDFSKDTHIVATHYPPILPKTNGNREDRDMIHAIVKSNALLHVSGHCHWAHGLYFPQKKKTPCVVASVCDSHWLNPIELLFSQGGRGDKDGDKWRGGYNVFFPPIVCDILIPGGPPKSTDVWIKKNKMKKPAVMEPFIHQHAQLQKPLLLFFGPPTDPDAVARLTPLFSKFYEVQHYEDCEEALLAIKDKNYMDRPFTACVVKLGSKGNLCYPILEALFAKSKETVLTVHSSTAMKSTRTKDNLSKDYGVQFIVDHTCEKELLEELNKIAEKWYLKNKK